MYGISEEAVVLPTHEHAEGQPSVTGTISVASSDTASLVGSVVVASALAQAMAQQVGVSTKDIEGFVTASSDGSGLKFAYAVQTESAVSAVVPASHGDAVFDGFAFRDALAVGGGRSCRSCGCED